MTFCPYCARLPQFLDHQFSEEEYRAIERHVETCPLCVEELERLTVADGAVLFSNGTIGYFQIKAGLMRRLGAR